MVTYTTGYKNSSGVDLGSTLITKEYLIDVYPALTPTRKLPLLFTWGDNSLGRIGDGTSVFKSSPVQIGSLTDWQVVAGGCATFGIKTSGQLWTWGSNQFGQAGLNAATSSTVGRSSPVQIGSLSNWKYIATTGGNPEAVAAVKTDGTLWTWGYNGLGSLGTGNTTAFSSPVQVGVLTNWKTISQCGAYAFAAIKTDGTLWSWGSNSGNLGTNDTTNRSSPTLISSASWAYLAKTSASAGHMGAIKTDGTLWMWGVNTSGQLGRGTSVNVSSPVQVGSLNTWTSVSCGSSFTMGILSNGTLWSWGDNSNGILGDGTVQKRSSPVQVGALGNWKTVSCGTSHTIALKKDGTIWSWGANQDGQLGHNDVTVLSSPVQIGSLNTWKYAIASIGASVEGGIALLEGSNW